MYDCTYIAEKHGITIKRTLSMKNNPKFELVLKLMRSLDVVVSSDICNFKHRKKKQSMNFINQGSIILSSTPPNAINPIMKLFELLLLYI